MMGDARGLILRRFRLRTGRLSSKLVFGNVKFDIFYRFFDLHFGLILESPAASRRRSAQNGSGFHLAVAGSFKEKSAVSKKKKNAALPHFFDLF